MKNFNYPFSNQNINRLHQIFERALLQTLRKSASGADFSRIPRTRAKYGTQVKLNLTECSNAGKAIKYWLGTIV